MEPTKKQLAAEAIEAVDRVLAQGDKPNAADVLVAHVAVTAAHRAGLTTDDFARTPIAEA